MRPERIYADTSVFGGCFDDEFQRASRRLLRQIRQGRFQLVTSALVQTELEPAPVRVRNVFNRLLPIATITPVTPEAMTLHRQYLDAKIVGEQWSTDALHVALATASKCAAIISWNFKHIVHFHKIPLYNAVNAKSGYAPIAICSPHEVIEHESAEEV